MLIVGNHHLFADAKILKYVSQHLISSNFAGNFAEIMETFADILRYEFTAEAGR